MTTRRVGAAAFAVLLALTACSGDTDEPVATTNGGAVDDGAGAPTDAETPGGETTGTDDGGDPTGDTGGDADGDAGGEEKAVQVGDATVRLALTRCTDAPTAMDRVSGEMVEAEQGVFRKVELRYTVESGEVEVNPLSWYWDAGDGSNLISYLPASLRQDPDVLSLGTLAAGETAEGSIRFDVPADGGELVFQQLGGQVLERWSCP